MEEAFPSLEVDDDLVNLKQKAAKETMKYCTFLVTSSSSINSFNLRLRSFVPSLILRCIKHAVTHLLNHLLNCVVDERRIRSHSVKKENRIWSIIMIGSLVCRCVCVCVCVCVCEAETYNTMLGNAVLGAPKS